MSNIDTVIKVADKQTPILFLWGPAYSGKSVLLYYLRNKGYIIGYDSIFNPYAEGMMEEVEKAIGEGVVISASPQPVMFFIRDNVGRKVLQIVDIPGDDCFNSEEQFSLPYINSLLHYSIH